MENYIFCQTIVYVDKWNSWNLSNFNGRIFFVREYSTSKLQNYWKFHPNKTDAQAPDDSFSVSFFKSGFTPCKAEWPLQGMELKEKEAQKDWGIQEICLERTYS